MQIINKFKMNQNNNGLTVGELTMTLAAICLVLLCWAAIGKKEKSSQSSLYQNSHQNAIVNNFATHS